MKRLFSLMLLVLLASRLPAQHLKAYAEYDYNRTERSMGNFVVASDFQLSENFHLDLGFQACTRNRYALNVAYQTNLIDAAVGTLYLENRYLYRLYPSFGIQEFNALLDLGWKNIHWNFQFGLCNRYMAAIPLRKDGGQGTIFEPMNVVFNLEWNLFPEEHPWNVGLGFSNYREFIIERVTCFFYTVHGRYDLCDQWQLQAEAGLHPAGPLNLSSQYNGFFFNVGFTYNYLSY